MSDMQDFVRISLKERPEIASDYVGKQPGDDCEWPNGTPFISEITDDFLVLGIKDLAPKELPYGSEPDDEYDAGSSDDEESQPAIFNVLSGKDG